ILTAPLGQITTPGLVQPVTQPCLQFAELRLLPFEKTQPRPQGFGGILVAPRCDQPVDKVGLGFRQNDVSGGHAYLHQGYWQYMPMPYECRPLAKCRFVVPGPPDPYWRGTVERMMVMVRSLQDKLARLDPARRA